MRVRLRPGAVVVTFTGKFQLRRRDVPFNVRFFNFYRFSHFLNVLPRNVKSFQFRVSGVFMLRKDNVSRLAAIIRPRFFRKGTLFRRLITVRIRFRRIRRTIVIHVHVFSDQGRNQLNLSAFQAMAIVSSTRSLVMANVLISTPTAPFNSMRISLTICQTSVRLPITKVILVPFAPIAHQVDLSIVICSTLILSCLRQVPQLMRLRTFPAITVIILVMNGPSLVPFAFLRHRVPDDIVVQVWRFQGLAPANVRRRYVNFKGSTRILISVFLIFMIRTKAYGVGNRVRVRLVTQHVIIVHVRQSKGPISVA